MRHPRKFVIFTLAASILLSACGSSSDSKSATSTTEAQRAASQTSGASGALVKTAANSKLGATILVDAQGMTLYHLSAEQNGKFICTSAGCLQVWHPLTVPSGSTPGGSVRSLGTVKRPDGTLQVTYKDMPLYSFEQDKEAGDASGQGIKDVGTWSTVSVPASTTGTHSTPAASGSSSSGSTSSSSGGGSGGGGSGGGGGETESSKSGGHYGY